MSLNAKVTNAVNKAFASVGDLVKTGTLTTKSVTSYDFATRSSVSTASTQNVEVIIQSKKRPSGEGFTVSAIMKTGVNLSVYDSITVDNITYNIVDYTDNDFIIEAILVKEA